MNSLIKEENPRECCTKHIKKKTMFIKPDVRKKNYQFWGFDHTLLHNFAYLSYNYLLPSPVKTFSGISGGIRTHDPWKVLRIQCLHILVYGLKQN